MKKKLIFKNVKDEFLCYCNFRRKRSTIDQYKKLLKRKHFLEFYGLDFRKINKSNLLKWKKQVSKLKCKIEYKKKNYSLLMSIYSYAKKKYSFINKNFEIFENFFDDPNEIIVYKENEICGLGEFNYYINCIDLLMNGKINADYKIRFQQLKIISLLCYYSGLRIGEAVALQVKDLKKISNQYYLIVNKTVYENTSLSKKIIVSSSKNKSSSRNLPLPKFLSAYLNQIIKEYNLKEDDFFSSFKCKLTNSTNSFRKRLLKVINRFNLKKYHFHIFRHSYASLLVENGESIETVSKLLGHSSTTITFKTYYHLLPETAIKAINNLELLALKNMY